jgi:MFS family permease
LAVAPETTDTSERLRLVRRNTLLLGGAQVALWGALGVFASFGPLTAFDLTHRASAAAIYLGLFYLAAAGGARLAGRLMDRAGRRPGLALGYVVLASSGLVAYWGAAAGNLVLLMASALVVGVGAGAALLGRAAVADMYPPERRGRAVGLLVMAGTLGAVGGPPLAGAVHAVAERAGAAEPLAPPWLLVVALALVALALVMAVRPDPRELAVGSEAPGGAGRPPGTILRQRPAAVAVVAIAVGQAVMVIFMGVIPGLLRGHHTGELAVSLVVSLHLGGMFALSPLIGAALDRWGRRAGLLAGALTSAAGVVLALLSQATGGAGAGLFLIGVGWSAAYLGSTAVVSDLAAGSERAGALGLADLIAALSAAAGVFGGAALLEIGGYTILAVTSLGLLTVPVLLLVPLRETTPGSWPMAAGSAPPAG